jgi:hypothetical protein
VVPGETPGRLPAGEGAGDLVVGVGGNALAGGLAFAAMFAYISGAPFIIEDAYRQPPLIFSLIFAVNGLGIILAGRV